MVNYPLISRIIPFASALVVFVAATSHLAAEPLDSGSSHSAPVLDPLDPFDVFGSEELLQPESDADKSAEELINEAVVLLSTERLLDARTKLLKALNKDPHNYRTYHLLAGYYLIYAGHYRLALKYIKRSEELFEAKNGPPPYKQEATRREHSNILYYLSQIRLNLDNYTGALEALDRFSDLGYYNESYAGSRAWILMKLGNLKEAIKVARAGALAGADEGRILNMLGILLSMNDQPQEAIEVFRKAIANELSLGIQGQAATPLNNAGEVYREMFEDDKAESSFLRATSLPDGCEHVLPTLNLVLLYIEQLKLEGAATAINNFEKCIAQFPLRNNEEHLALVNLARGRLDLHTGHTSRAIARFETALEGTQWFGKIGTNQNDLLVGATISLAQALSAQNNIEKTRISASWGEWLAKEKKIAANALRSWWLLRRARQMLINDLNDLEDLTIRNTDSLLEYPTLSDVLAGLSHTTLSRRLARQRERDSRGPAKLFYDIYLAQASLNWWQKKQGVASLDSIIERARPKYDELLRTKAILTRLSVTPVTSSRYRELTYRIFFTTPAHLRNSGYPLPITIVGAATSEAVRKAILSGPFAEYTQGSELCQIQVSHPTTSTPEVELHFSCNSNSAKNRTVRDSDINQVVNKLSDALFSEEISNGRNT